MKQRISRRHFLKPAIGCNDGQAPHALGQEAMVAPGPMQVGGNQPSQALGIGGAQDRQSQAVFPQDLVEVPQSNSRLDTDSPGGGIDGDDFVQMVE